jgi:hypothetical protein
MGILRPLCVHIDEEFLAVRADIMVCDCDIAGNKIFDLKQPVRL